LLIRAPFTGAGHREVTQRAKQSLSSRLIGDGGKILFEFDLFFK